MRSLAHTVPSRLVIPFGVWFSFNFGNTLFNLLFIFGSDSHSRCHSSCSKLLILFPKSKATIVFEASFSDRASFAASSASSLPTNEEELKALGQYILESLRKRNEDLHAP